MNVRSRMIELNGRIENWLNDKGIITNDNETTTTLIQKLETTSLMFNNSSLMPTVYNTTNPNLNDPERNMYSDKGCWFPGDQTHGNSFGFYNIVPNEEYPKSWPHITTEYNEIVQVPNLKLFVDASHSDEFNMCLWAKDSEQEESYSLWLDDIVGMGDKIVDFPSPKTTLMANLGTFIANEGHHANTPKVSNKVDILNAATGKSKGYKFIPNENDIYGQRSLGDHSNPNSLFAETFDLNKTPYLYYSINQPADSRCTFALYTENPADKGWWIGRKGENKNEAAPTFSFDYLNYNASEWHMAGPQTGCINLLELLLASNPDNNQENFIITELKLYGMSAGSADGYTDATFNYLFLGDAPTEEENTGWGIPATPSKPIIYAPAVGGEIILDRIDYYVVGGYEDWVRLNSIRLAYPYA